MHGFGLLWVVEGGEGLLIESGKRRNGIRRPGEVCFWDAERDMVGS